jgi:alkyl hydroperoxide reductase subunit AhpC
MDLALIPSQPHLLLARLARFTSPPQYPEASTDKGLRLGNICPDFKADTTQGPMEFHKWKEGKWAILFSHPADFTPVCTTEIGRLALKYDTLAAMDCLVATLSVDPVKSHTEWLTDVVAHCENKIEIKFPIIGDQDRNISTLYGMIDPGTSDEQSLPLTIRAVFIINPENKLMLSLNYPACVGRNMDEACASPSLNQWNRSSHPVTPDSIEIDSGWVPHASLSPSSNRSSAASRR